MQGIEEARDVAVDSGDSTRMAQQAGAETNFEKY
jgi:hypothetical protein